MYIDECTNFLSHLFRLLSLSIMVVVYNITDAQLLPPGADHLFVLHVVQRQQDGQGIMKHRILHLKWELTFRFVSYAIFALTLGRWAVKEWQIRLLLHRGVLGSKALRTSSDRGYCIKLPMGALRKWTRAVMLCSSLISLDSRHVLASADPQTE